MQIAQQYKIMMENVRKAQIGGLVYDIDGNNSVIGFISGTDNKLYVEFTLFKPILLSKLPEYVYDVFPKVDAIDVFNRCSPYMNADMIEYWHGMRKLPLNSIKDDNIQ